MKKIIMIFSILLIGLSFTYAQAEVDEKDVPTVDVVETDGTVTEAPATTDDAVNESVLEVEEEFKENVIGGFSDLVKLLNYLFIAIFIVSAWLINDTADAENAVKWMNWWSKVPKILRSLIIGAVWIVIFIWVFRYTAREEIFGLILSLLASMVIYKVGIDKLLRWLSVKSGMKFADKKAKPQNDN